MLAHRPRLDLGIGRASPAARRSSSTATIPRTIGIAADRPDHQLQVAFDRETGLILRLVETIGGEVTRDAVVTSLVPDAALTPSRASTSPSRPGRP